MSLARSLSSISELQVFMGGREVGTLAATQHGLAAFQYSPQWLESGYSISPFSLPLENKVFVANPHPLNGLFGVFDDSLPDGWGRLLVDRMLGEHGIDPNSIGFMGRLSIVGNSGSGALEYRPVLHAFTGSAIRDLDAIADECAAVLASQNAQDLDALFSMGGSSGGARPKVFYEIDGEEWIVKFPSSVDPSDIGEKEYKLALAAAECGIDMAEVRLLPSVKREGYFATKRFDRMRIDDGSTKKVHMVSVAALLETTHRVPNLDYETLMRLTLRLTGDAQEVERMYRLMVFNVLCGNRDDHSKNFSFLCDEQGVWRLSPAYDITTCSGMNGEHAMTVNGKGRNVEDEDMLAVAKGAGLSLTKAREVIVKTREVLG